MASRAATIGELGIEVNLELAKMSAQFTTLNARIAKQGKQIRRQFQQVGNSIRRALTFAAGAVGIGGLSMAAQSAFRLASELDNTSKKLGLSTKEIQVLGFAAEQYGVTQSAVNMGLQRFSRRLAEAQQGTGSMLPVLQQYNIRLHDTEGNARNATDVMRDLADAVQRAGNPTEQLRIAFKAFDSEGAALVSVLRDGSAGLDRWAEKATEVGRVMEEDTIKSLANAERAITNFRQRIVIAIGNVIVNFRSETAIQKLSFELLGAAAGFGGQIIDFIFEAGQLIPIVFKEAFRSAFNFGTEDLAPFMERIQDAMAFTTQGKFSQEFSAFWKEQAAILGELLEKEKGVAEEIIRLLAGEPSVRMLKSFVFESEASATIIAAAWKSMGDGISRSFGEMIVTAGQGLDSFADSVRGIFRKLVVDIASEWARLQIVKPLMDAITGTGVLGTIGKALGFGAVPTGAAAAPSVAGKFAAGGRPPVGRPSLIGEQGPELFVPDAAGTIVPNGGFGGGGQTVVNQTNHFHAGADRASILQLLPKLVEASSNMTINRALRGGAVRRAFA